jgi:hypothetical protein
MTPSMSCDPDTVPRPLTVKSRFASPQLYPMFPPQ